MFGMAEIFERIYCDTCLGWQRYLRGFTVIHVWDGGGI